MQPKGVKQMFRAAVIYAPADGPVQALADRIAKSLAGSRIAVSLKPAASASISDLAACDLILLGCASQGKSPIHSDFAEIVRALAGINLAGRVAGVFALASEAALLAWKKALKDTDIRLEPDNLLLAKKPEVRAKELSAWDGQLAAQLEERAGVG